MKQITEAEELLNKTIERTAYVYNTFCLFFTDKTFCIFQGCGWDEKDAGRVSDANGNFVFQFERQYDEKGDHVSGSIELEDKVLASLNSTFKMHVAAMEEYASIVNERNENIPADFKQVTGHDSPKEMVAYEKGREDEQQVIIEWIEKWDGSSNSVMGALLKKKFNELFTYPQ